MQYSNNVEYRQCLRTFFKMNTETYSNAIQSDWDEETIDEMSYDETAVSNALDEIYNKTQYNILFEKIYSQAAAKMISTDKEIGLAVCISYDYFSHFYACIELFKKKPEHFTEESKEYNVLYKALT